MNDVFISYARADREHAHRLADVLEAQGLSVWWDHDLAPGQKFATVIAQELATARCVLVLWSQASVASHWVGDEAAEGQRRDVLVPAIIDPGMQAPLGFRGLQTADLSDWVRGGSDAPLQRLCEAIHAVVHGRKPPPAPPPAPPPPAPAPAPPPPPPPPPPPGGLNLKRNIGIGMAVLVGGAAYVAWEPGVYPPPDGYEEPLASAPLQGPLNWADQVLDYNGHVQWDGQRPVAELSATLIDRPTGRALGDRQVVANAMRNGPGQVEFFAVFDVPFDSDTPMRHTHRVQLRFSHDGTRWNFIGNCAPWPGKPRECM